MKAYVFSLLMFSLGIVKCFGQENILNLPVIDMHLHVYSNENYWGGNDFSSFVPFSNTVLTSPKTNDGHIKALYSSSLTGQIIPDSALLSEINKIKAIDNHSHYLPFNTNVINQTLSKDAQGTTPFLYPVRLRVDNPEFMEAWRFLYGYKYDDMNSEHIQEALRAKLFLMREKGEGWPAWILDKNAIQIGFVNLPSLGPGQQNSRFRWVPHADALISPYSHQQNKYIEGTAIKRILSELHEEKLPGSLEAYTLDIISQTIVRWKEQGAIAVKIALAYSRTLDFNKVPEAEAEQIYLSLLDNKDITETDYKNLEDYLFHFLAREAGRIGLVVHIHTGIGADPYFNISGSDPMLLEPTFNDPELRNTNFVIIHGGWPFDKQAGVLLIKPNVYADFSAQTFLRSPRALSETLRAWLEWYPEKILFGSDAYPDPNTPLTDWEEKLWLANKSAREALAIALTGMMNDGQITREVAIQLAQMVLRNNAVQLYKLDLNK